MTAHEYLRQYEFASRRVARLEEELEEELAMIDAVRSVSDNDGMPHGSGISKPTEDKAIRLADKTQRLAEARLEAVRIRQEVYDIIEKVGGYEADVLKARYVDLLTWECVCMKVCYSWPKVRELWHRGEAIVGDLLQDITR